MRVLTNSKVGTSGCCGCCEFESPAVVLVVFVGGLANIGRQVVISVCRKAASTNWKPASGEIPERPTTLARAESLGPARRRRSSSCREEWHGRGMDPGLGHLPHDRKRGGSQ